MTDLQNHTEVLIKQKILVIDDEPIVGLSCKRILESEKYEVVIEQNPKTGLQEALSGKYILILLDLILPDIDGMEILKMIKSSEVNSEVVIITGYATVQTAVEAIKTGAADYVSKPFSPDELKLTIEKVIKHSALIKENIALKKELQLHQGLMGIISVSPKMEKIFSIIKRVAPTDGTVFITGESGTGKELIAQAIHRLSLRKDKPFIACDCSSLAPTLLESELFGHTKGSFSGAIATKQGLFEVANKGTLFFDEVSNISLETQSKLLRVIETRRFRRVGDPIERTTDIRLIAASNQDLLRMVKKGSFREDLFYRLQVIPVHLPPLRERQEDIIILATVFLNRVRQNNEISSKRFAPESIEIIENYKWPGNVRELKNMVERIAILCDSEIIQPKHLPKELFGLPEKYIIDDLPKTWEEFKKLRKYIQDNAIAEIEKRFLREAMKQANGNISLAAKEVRMHRTNFHLLLRKYNIKGS